MNCDSYKLGHASQYPEGTQFVYSNFTARSDKYLPIPQVYKDGKYVVFGINRFLSDFHQLWQENFFGLYEEDFDAEMESYVDSIIPFVGPNGPDDISNRLHDLYQLGHLPLEFSAVPEGTVLDINKPCLTVWNTEPEFYWLVNYVETWLSTELWKTMTIATIARFYRKALTKYCIKTGGVPELIDWQAHDFSMRGLGSLQDSYQSSIGHLLYFTGTDVLPAVATAKHYYRAADPNYLYGGSVPATEHSVLSMGTKDGELDTFKRLLDKYPSGIVSIVSDTWDYWKVLTEYALELKDQILNRVPDQFGIAKTVFRPDSGDPVKIICGTAISVRSNLHEDDLSDDITQLTTTELEYAFKDKLREGENIVFSKGKYYIIRGYWQAYYDDSLTFEVVSEVPAKPEYIGSLRLLWEIFGGTQTETGHILLNQRVGLIYGDSITPQRMLDILQGMEELGFCSSNLVFGVGSYTYQHLTRDSLGFAMKATYGEVNGESRMLSKDPVTDSGTKKSATGCLVVTSAGDLIQGLTFEEMASAEDNILREPVPVGIDVLRVKALAEINNS